jgi:hypothetical protein
MFSHGYATMGNTADLVIVFHQMENIAGAVAETPLQYLPPPIASLSLPTEPPN